MTRWRVVVADDHVIVRKGLELLIDEEQDLEVVGVAEDGNEAIEMAEKHLPDVVMMDISMPRMDGIEATKEVKQRFPSIKVLVLSIHEHKTYLRQALEAGATGYVLKRTNAKELLNAVRVVAGGDVYLDPSLSGKIVSSIIRGPAGDLTTEPCRLTERETEVMTLIAQGYSNKEIAERLSISVKTVETHRARAMEKLGFENRADIVRYAMRQGWLDNL